MLWFLGLMITGYIGKEDVRATHQEDDYISRVKLIMFILLEADSTILSHHPYRANQGSISFFHSHLFYFYIFYLEHWGQCSV